MDWLAGCGTGGPGGTAVGAAMGRALGLLAGYSPADLTPSSSDIQTLVTAAEYIKALATSLPQEEHTDPGSLHHVDGHQSERNPQNYFVGPWDASGIGHEDTAAPYCFLWLGGFYLFSLPEIFQLVSCAVLYFYRLVRPCRLSVL